MTVSSTNRKAGPYAGNGATVSFPFTFKVFSASDLLVVRADAAGAETTLALTTDYTVSLNADQNASPGGTVTPVVVLATGYSLTLSSAMDYLQPVDLTNAGGFYPAVINTALDRLTIFAQQLAEKVSRSLKMAISTPTGVDPTLPAPVPYQLISWNGDGTGFQNTDPTYSTALATDLASGSSSKGSFLIGWIQSGIGAIARTVRDKLREYPSVKDFGAVGDGVTDDTAALTAAQNAHPYVEVPAGMNCKVTAGLNYWKFFGKGAVFETGKQWSLAPHPQTGAILKGYIPRTFGTYEQAVGSSITINSGVGQTKENTQVLGTNTQGLAQTYTDRDHVAQYISASSYTPDVLDATTTYTSTTLTNAAVSALNAAGSIKPGMIIDTRHADICTGRVQSVAGNVITVDAWYARSGGGAITPATLTGAIINPNNKIFGQNLVVSALGNSTTTGASKFSGVELDLITPVSAVPIAGTWGYDMSVLNGGYIDVGYQIRGKRNVSFFSTNAGGAGLFGFRSVGDARGISIEDATTNAMEVLQGGTSKGSIGIDGTVTTPATVSNGATAKGLVAAQVTTAFTNVGTLPANGSLFWITGFNIAGGAEGMFVLSVRSGVVGTILSSDGTGLGVTFQVVGRQLQIKTTSGTFQFVGYQISA